MNTNSSHPQRLAARRVSPTATQATRRETDFAESLVQVKQLKQNQAMGFEPDLHSFKLQRKAIAP